jgi:hypothetical protein
MLKPAFEVLTRRMTSEGVKVVVHAPKDHFLGFEMPVLLNPNIPAVILVFQMVSWFVESGDGLWRFGFARPVIKRTKTAREDFDRRTLVLSGLPSCLKSLLRLLLKLAPKQHHLPATALRPAQAE